jgi:uncharacterized iron-regulated membrane protein
MPSRTFQFWTAIHRYVGLATLAFLAFAALTGSALCFERVIDAGLNADLFDQPAPIASPPPASVVDQFHARHPEWVIAAFPLNIPADQRIPVTVSPRDGVDQIFLDRATGTIAGMRSTAPSLTRHGGAQWLHNAHYTLMAGDAGRWLMGGVSALWLVSNLVGLYLTFPQRGAFWRQWKRNWRFSFKSSFARLMLDLHRAPGLWLLLPFTVLALSGVALNFFEEAYAPMLTTLTHEVSPTQPATNQPPHTLTFTSATSAAIAVAHQRHEAWQPGAAEYDAKADRISIALTDDGQGNYHGLGPINYAFDRQSGALVEVYDPYRANLRLAGIRWLYPAHSGRVFGLATITLVFLSGLATAMMCVTGAYVWWKKRKIRRR